MNVQQFHQETVIAFSGHTSTHFKQRVHSDSQTAVIRHNCGSYGSCSMFNG